MGAPVAVTSGRASAAASDTIPRMLVQEIMKIAANGGIGSRARIAGLSQRGSAVARGTQTRRTRITSAAITSPLPPTVSRASVAEPSIRSPNSAPSSRKTSELSPKRNRSQTARACTREAGATTVEKCCRR